MGYGMNNMSIDKSIAIVGLARDCEEPLINNIRKINYLRENFKSSVVVIVENDSIDGTKTILEKWTKQEKNIVIISKDYHSKTNPSKSKEFPFPGGSRYRIEKLCSYRNEYMNYLQLQNIDCDYLLVIDLDVDDFDEKGVMTALCKAPADWVALFANGISYFKFFLNIRVKLKYYDGYAFIPSSENMEDNIMIDLTYKEMLENKYMIAKLLKESSYIECISAFGGIGIYKYDYIKDRKYSIIENKRSPLLEVICEHILFNLPLQKHGKCYISRSMIVYNKRSKAIKSIFLNLLPLRIFFSLFKLKRKEKFPE
jgi:hypothetical protein